MQYYIYGLIDPRDYRVRYVGRTCQRMDQRLRHHINAAKRGNQKPIYQWLRGLLPMKPWLVCLAKCEDFARMAHVSGQRVSAEFEEVKWIKRFRRTCLNELSHEERKKDWKELVNR